MKIKLFLVVAMTMFVMGIALIGCGTSNVNAVSSKLIASEKTGPLDFFELAEQGVLAYKISNQEEYITQWQNFRLKEDPIDIDWNNQTVIFLGLIESGTCPFQFENVELKNDKTEIIFQFKEETANACTDDATPRTIVIVMDSNELNNVSVLKIDDYFGINPSVGFKNK